MKAGAHAHEPSRRTDAALLADVVDGDLSALGTLFDRHHARVRRVLARTGARDDTDDLVQATFLELPKLARAFDGRESCAAWLCGIAVRLASRRRRSIARMLRALGSFASSASRVDAVDPERDFAGREELDAFARALEALAPKKRDAFVLVELEGFTAEEVSAVLDVPPATVRTRLFHARAELRDAMKGVGT